jgi:hypothetical protein
LRQEVISTEAYDKDELPDMKEIILLHEGNKDDWFWFADKVVECVAGKRVWGKQKTMNTLTETVTASDEAFALLVLVNNWDKWKAEQETP